MSEPNITEQEIWKPIPSTNGLYEASDFGRIRSAEKLIVLRTGELVGTILAYVVKPRKSAAGYPGVVVRNTVGRVIGGNKTNGGNAQLTRTVHQLVAEAFHGPRPSNYDVNHKNGDRGDNRPENLEYVTRSFNISDSYRRGRRAASRPGRTYRKLSDADVQTIISNYASGSFTQIELAKTFGVRDTHICQIVNGKRRAKILRKLR